jgi:hypothetical protein
MVSIRLSSRTQLAAKYGVEKAQAQRDVDALMNGRQI